MIWAEASDGVLSVKSAYFIARILLGKRMPNHESQKKVWRLLWMSATGPRVRTFIWKLVYGILHCAVGLGKRY